MFDFLNDREYLEARNDEEWYYFGKVNVPLPSWDEILTEFDRVYKESISLKNENIEVQKHFGMKVHYFEGIEIISQFLESIKKSHTIRNDQSFDAACFMSLTSVDSMFGKHKDGMDVWLWQIQGKSRWQVEGLEENYNFDKIVEPGELLYIPRGSYHNITSLEPRVSISFGCENPKFY